MVLSPLLAVALAARSYLRAQRLCWSGRSEDLMNGGRILTTHVGSLPRPQDVVDVVFGEDRGEDVDRERYEQVIRDAVADRVRHQAEAGVDVVSDGEMSKIGYATYIRHRLSGFEVGDVPRATPADLHAYPRSRKRIPPAGGRG